MGESFYSAISIEAGLEGETRDERREGLPRSTFMNGKDWLKANFLIYPADSSSPTSTMTLRLHKLNTLISIQPEVIYIGRSPLGNDYFG